MAAFVCSVIRVEQAPKNLRAWKSGVIVIRQAQWPNLLAAVVRLSSCRRRSGHWTAHIASEDCYFHVPIWHCVITTHSLHHSPQPSDLVYT